MKYFLFLIVIFFTSFSFDYQEKWVCHTVTEKPGLTTCMVVVIKAKDKEGAERKFDSLIKKREVYYGTKESKEPVHYVVKLNDAIMIEP